MVESSAFVQSWLTCLCVPMLRTQAGQMEGKGHLLQIDDRHCVFWQAGLVESVIATALFLCGQ